MTKCPTCSELSVDKIHAPFCSRRCSQVDLGRWFSGEYAVPSTEPPDGTELEMIERSFQEKNTNGTSD